MEPEFWLERWRLNETGFHRDQPHAMLTQLWSAVQAPPTSTVFVPLCGKTWDLVWLRTLGHKVLGVELSPLAIHQFFSEHDTVPRRTEEGPFEIYGTEGITLFRGDVFDMTAAQLHAVTAVYDRAALVALPPDLQEKYAIHLGKVLPEHVRILLVVLDYDPSETTGPPFNVSDARVRDLFQARFNVSMLVDNDALVPGEKLRERGLTWLRERAYLLSPP